MTTQFEEAKPTHGIRCHMSHKNLSEKVTAFPGTLLDHMKRWHTDVYRETMRINAENHKRIIK